MECISLVIDNIKETENKSKWQELAVFGTLNGKVRCNLVDHIIKLSRLRNRKLKITYLALKI